jgi:L,D-peptidoglycan transpeptidase YkuD (ErfK/YbiS/YcfS/YnhG family)
VNELYPGTKLGMEQTKKSALYSQDSTQKWCNNLATSFRIDLKKAQSVKWKSDDADISEHVNASDE